MMSMHISPNRHEWNERRVLEMQDEIKEQKIRVEETKGFFNKWKEKRTLRKMIIRQRKHGEEVFEYEIQNRNNANR